MTISFALVKKNALTKPVESTLASWLSLLVQVMLLTLVPLLVIESSNSSPIVKVAVVWLILYPLTEVELFLELLEEDVFCELELALELEEELTKELSLDEALEKIEESLLWELFLESVLVEQFVKVMPSNNGIKKRVNFFILVIILEKFSKIYRKKINKLVNPVNIFHCYINLIYLSFNFLLKEKGFYGSIKP